MKLFCKMYAAGYARVNPETLRRHANQNYIPQPSIQKGKRKFYTRDDLEIIRQHFEKPSTQIKTEAHKEAKLYTSKEAADLLRVASSTFYDLQRKGIVPYPKIPALTVNPSGNSNRQKRYNAHDIAVMKHSVSKIRGNSATRLRDEMNAKGYYSCGEAAKKLGIPQITLTSWFNNGSIQKPTHRPTEDSLYAYFVDADLKAIRKAKRKYFSERKDK